MLLFSFLFLLMYREMSLFCCDRLLCLFLHMLTSQYVAPAQKNEHHLAAGILILILSGISWHVHLDKKLDDRCCIVPNSYAFQKVA